MHFQTPPNDHSKIVSCINGTALDVALDIRKDSSTYGQFFSVEISKENGLMVYIPKVSHMVSLQKQMTVLYFIRFLLYTALNQIRVYYGLHLDMIGVF